jgi:hypothetical protein
MSTARAPWHRLAGPAEAPETPCHCGAGPLSACPGDWNGRCGANAANGYIETPPRLYLAAALEPIELPPHLTRYDSAEVAAATLQWYRANSDAEARALEEAVEYEHEGAHRSASKTVAALAVAYLGGWATHAAMPWIAPALLRAMGITG